MDKIWILFVLCIVSVSCAASTCNLDKVREYFEVDVFLSSSMSLSDVEKREMRDVEGSDSPLPFGLLNPEWLKFKEQYKNGDCIIYFKTSKESWKAFHGREGYLLVRNGEPISVLATRMN